MALESAGVAKAGNDQGQDRAVISVRRIRGARSGVAAAGAKAEETQQDAAQPSLDGPNLPWFQMFGFTAFFSEVRSAIRS